MATERLQKILAYAGYGSRRACELMISEGRVAVDGKLAHLGDKADPNTQRITVDGVPLRRRKRDFTYVALYKPRGVISTTSDPQGRRTVSDLVNLSQRLYPVGRLDADSEGLVLLTDDGELTQHLTHPRYGHPRVYDVLVEGEPTGETLSRWKRGIVIEGKKARFTAVEVKSPQRGVTWLRITVREGRKHLIRRMTAALGHPTLRLIRVAIGPLQLGKLKPRQWRYLTAKEIHALRREVGLESRSNSRTRRRR